jgi:hypothetical protein
LHWGVGEGAAPRWRRVILEQVAAMPSFCTPISGKRVRGRLAPEIHMG